MPATDVWMLLPRRLRVLLRQARMKLDPVVGPFVARRLFGVVSPEPDPDALSYLRRLPPLPGPLRRVKVPPVWDEEVGETPRDLRGVAGIARDTDAEERAWKERPLHNYFLVHSENLPLAQKHTWHYVLPNFPRLGRATARAARLRSAKGLPPGGGGPPPEEMTARIRAEARRLGVSGVGFAPYDPKYTLAEYAGTHDEGSVVVCLFEQDWDATQTAPSARAERAAFAAYAGLNERVVALAEFVEQQGYRAHPHSFLGETMAIHYGVAAGLGQLGLNGQLLTPAAGSRARLTIITTNASLVHDHPVDYGIAAICDACQACVRRCPVGAIPNRRKEHRGVTKAKIKTERCFPVVVSAEGCAVCMKVCPVQRYGLPAVHKHWASTGGQILGRGTDELEGYDWPLDGRHYEPGRKPDAKQVRKVLNPPHWQPVDPTRTAPPIG